MVRQCVLDVDMFFPSSSRFEWLYEAGECHGFYLRQTGIECNSDSRLVLVTTLWVDDQAHCSLWAKLDRFDAQRDACAFVVPDTVAFQTVWDSALDASFALTPPRELEELYFSLQRSGFDQMQDEEWAQAQVLTTKVVGQLAP
jgi:hypothetical protein